MHILEVIPIAVLPRNQSQILSYFHTQALPRGAVVEVGLRNRKIKAVVLESRPLKSLKLALKKESLFELKNISKVISKIPQVSPQQIELAMWMSSYYFAPLGQCLKTVLPSFWGSKKYHVDIKKGVSKTEYEISYSVTKNLTKHFEDYIEEVEKNKNGQVLLLVPEHAYAKYFLDKYLKFNPIYVHSGLSNRELYETWRRVQSGEQVFIIGTRASLFLPFTNLKMLIVDDEPNELYSSEMSPRYNAPDVARKLTLMHGARLIINALVPSLETYSASRSSWFTSNLSFNGTIVNMKDELSARNFSLLSRDLQDAILTNAGKKENMALFVPRRGYSPAILCQKCGSSITCPDCKASMVSHHQTNELICHHCGYKEHIPQACPSCGSRQLKSIGIGIEKIISAIDEFFKKRSITSVPLFRLDSDVIKSADEAEKIIKKFLNSRGSILLATHMLLSRKYLIKLPFIGIISMDSLSAFNDFRTEERTAKILRTIGSMANRLLIQTNNPANSALQALQTKSLKGFFDDELELRESLSYPPSAQIIIFEYRHRNPTKAGQEAQKGYEFLKRGIMHYKTEIISLSEPFPASIEKEKGLYIWQMMMKVKVLDYADRIFDKESIKKRSKLLHLLPSGWQIFVDPING